MCPMLLFLPIVLSFGVSQSATVINTWNFPSAASKAWEYVENGESAVSSLVAGCSICEMDEAECGYSVGYGGKPDESGDTTLDAMVYDGSKMDMGAVGGLKDVKNAIAVAKDVLEHTGHSLLVGGSATDFAVRMGFEKESLVTDYSASRWRNWTQGHCQPNFWKDVEPDPNENCGPYSKISENSVYYYGTQVINSENHDTIGMVVIDKDGNVAAGTSTNGLTYKISGRVGDSPLPGGGAYADNEVGAAVATGDGDVMMRFLPTFLAVEEMRRGATPAQASRTAVSRIARHYPDFSGAIIAVDKEGNYATACNGMTSFPYVVAVDGNVTLQTDACVDDATSSGVAAERGLTVSLGGVLCYPLARLLLP